MSQAYLCIALDATKLLVWIARRVAASAGSSTSKAFLAYFALSAAMTICTSNDIVVLTLTPVILEFASARQVDAEPFVISSFFAANVWSLILLIGNPTNIIVGEAFQVTFPLYFQWMALPSIIVGSLLLLALWFLFKDQIQGHQDSTEEHEAIFDQVHVDWSSAKFGSFVLASCLFLLTISPLINAPLYVITLCCSSLYALRNAIYFGCKSREKFQLEGTGENKITVQDFWLPFRNLPWAVVPFVCSMFILLECLSRHGWISRVASLMIAISPSPLTSGFSFLLVGTLLGNLMNNQPMTIFMTKVLIECVPRFSEKTLRIAIFSLIVASNVAANFTAVGALAGIMWTKIIREKGLFVSPKRFFFFGSITMIPLASLFVLILLAQVQTF